MLIYLNIWLVNVNSVLIYETSIDHFVKTLLYGTKFGKIRRIVS